MKEVFRVDEDHLNVNLFIDASAGTGKTTTLIRRLMEFIITGTPLSRIVAITFTRNAAAEMKTRLRLHLERACDPDDESEYRELTDDERRRCKEALGELDAAAIETIHAFCARILKMFPIEAGLPPRCENLEEDQSRVLFRQWWDETLASMLADDELAEVWQTYFEYGYKTDTLETVAESFNQWWHLLEKEEVFTEYLPQVDWSGFNEAADKIIALIEHCSDQEDVLYTNICDFAQRVHDVRLSPENTRFELLAGLKQPLLRGGKKASWDIEITQLRQLIRDACFNEAVEDLRGNFRYRSIAPLVNRIRLEVLNFVDKRKQDGQLEFHDLLSVARNLLINRNDIRLQIQKMYPRVMIDEFQDTDPLQVEIVFLICGEREPYESFCWTNTNIPDGRITLVGDPKQSIYRFRGADVTLFNRTKQTLNASEKHLSKNWRSCGQIIRWVNEVFEIVMDDSYDELEPGRADLDDDLKRVWVFGGESEHNAETTRQTEADDVVKIIGMATSQEDGWRVIDTDNKEAKAKLNDIAILIPGRTCLPALEDALDAANIPYRIESQSLVYGSGEVQDLLSTLRSICDPSDQVALIASLKGLLFSCSDRDLYDWKAAGGKWNYLADIPDGMNDSSVAFAMNRLKHYHEARLRIPAGEMVDMILRDEMFLLFALTQPKYRETVRRLQFFAGKAREFVISTGGTLLQFVDWIEFLVKSGARDVETILPENDEEAVRIMTIHAAKGLEFPIVILTGLTSEENRAQTVEVAWSQDGIPAIKWGSAGNNETLCRSYGATAILEYDRQQLDLEKNRLLYVAATRAKYHLAVSLYHIGKSKRDASKPLPLGLRLHSAIKQLHDDEFIPDHLPDIPVSQDSNGKPEIKADTAEDRENWETEHKQLLELLSVMPVTAATKLAKEVFEASDDVSLDKENEVVEYPIGRTGRGGSNIGRAVHAVLQSIDLTNPEDIASASASQADAEGLDDSGHHVVESKVRSILQCDPLKSCLESGCRYWREVFVSAMVEGVLIEGFIDFLYQGSDGRLHVVDFKTDHVGSEQDIEQKMERYEIQGAAYVLALETGRDLKVEDVTFIFSQEDSAYVRQIEDLEAAKSRTMSILGKR